MGGAPPDAKLDELIKQSQEAVKRLDDLTKNNAVPFTQRVSRHFGKHGAALVNVALAGSLMVVALGRLGQKRQHQVGRRCTGGESWGRRCTAQRVGWEAAGLLSLTRAPAGRGRRLAAVAGEASRGDENVRREGVLLAHPAMKRACRMHPVASRALLPPARLRCRAEQQLAAAEAVLRQVDAEVAGAGGKGVAKAREALASYWAQRQPPAAQQDAPPPPQQGGRQPAGGGQVHMI